MAVYAIRNKRSGSVKVGFSRSPPRRIRTLQTGNEDELVIESSFTKGSHRTESKLKAILERRGEGIRGEWFQGPMSECVARFLRMVDSEEKYRAVVWLIGLLQAIGPKKRSEFMSWLNDWADSDRDVARLASKIEALRDA